MTTYYVSNSGDNSNNGTSTVTAWQTLSKIDSLAGTFVGGDSILLKRGDTWNETFFIFNVHGASGNPITFGAYDSGARPVVDGQNTRTFAVHINTSTHFVLQDIHATNAVSDGVYAVAGAGDVSDVLIQRVLSDLNGRDGFGAEGNPGTGNVDDYTCRDCEAYKNGRAGFFALNITLGAVGLHYYTSKSTYSGQAEASHGFSGSSANGVHYHTSEAAFTNYDPDTGTPTFLSEGIGFAFDDLSSSGSIEFCYSHDNFGAGVALAHQADGNVASYNLIVRNGGQGLVVNGNSAGSDNPLIYGNTIADNGSHGIEIFDPSAGALIKNNILASNGGFGIQFSASGVTGYAVATNIIYGNTGDSNNVTGATGTISASPAFVGSGDYSLRASSPAIDAGINLGSTYTLGLKSTSSWPSGVITTDQGTAWEIGAYVYDAAPPPPSRAASC